MDKGKMELLFGILNALGSLATFFAFILLFRKDKDKQKQIDKLTSIATILDAQADAMRKQNDLMSQQVDIFRNTSILKNQDDQALKKLHEIEEKKLRLSVKPNLWMNGVGTQGHRGEIKFDLNNKGETAYLTDIILVSGDIDLHSLSIPYELEKGARRYIFGTSKGDKHITDCSYEIRIIYTDSLKNQYESKIKGIGLNGKLENLD